MVKLGQEQYTQIIIYLFLTNNKQEVKLYVVSMNECEDKYKKYFFALTLFQCFFALVFGLQTKYFVVYSLIDFSH